MFGSSPASDDMNFKKLFNNIFKEEIDLDKYILCFKNGYKKINDALLNGTTLKHNDDVLLTSIKEISTSLKKDDISSEKYNELIKAMTDYNKIFNLYKNKRGSDGKTIGDCFRQLGAKTNKSSTKTD